MLLNGTHRLRKQPLYMVPLVIMAACDRGAEALAPDVTTPAFDLTVVFKSAT